MNLKNKITALVVLFTIVNNCAFTQNNLYKDFEHLFSEPKNYVVGYTTNPPVIDGDITEDSWQKAEWTEWFMDIEGDKKSKPYYSTRAKLMWDKKNLYVAAELEDPHVWGKLTDRDEVVFYDNDFEIFLNPNNTTHEYFEIEINALNTIFDLYMNKPYREGAGALISWDTPGMQHAVKVNGTLNNAADTDKGWTVEFSIPLRALTVGNNAHIPKDKETWRLNFSRVEWDVDIANGEYIKQKDKNGKTKPENNWVWSPQGVINMHLPERWGYLQFSEKEVGFRLPAFQLPYEEKMRRVLWLLYYKQKEYRNKNVKYATTLSELGLPEKINIDGEDNKLQIEATSSLFQARVIDVKNNTLQINNEGLIIRIKK